MSIASQHNIGAFLHAAAGGALDSIVAGGGGNGVQVQGSSVDRVAQNLPLSASILYVISATVASAKTLTLAYNIQHSVDNSTWVDFQDTDPSSPGAPLNQIAATVEIAGTGAAVNIVVKQDVNLLGANQYVRVQYTPTLNATSTDVATIAPVWVLGGMDLLP